jgi:branched-chain amino acid aminotransferase
MSPPIYINGKYFSKEDAKISVYDHGLLYGDGVFEGMRTYSNKVFRLDEHIDRLYESARAILLTIPMSKQEMIDAVKKTVELSGLSDSYIRLVVTRGSGSLGLDPNRTSDPQVIIIVDLILSLIHI